MRITDVDARREGLSVRLRLAQRDLQLFDHVSVDRRYCRMQERLRVGCRRERA